MLSEREGIDLSRSTIRSDTAGRGMAESEAPQGARRYSRRERYRQEGMLLQIDGSRHDWGRNMMTVGAVDDATPAAAFRTGDTTTC